MNRVSKNGVEINTRRQKMKEAMATDPAREAKLAAIQSLIGIGLKNVEEELQSELQLLTGKRYARGKEMGSWGNNWGSVYLADQKVKVRVPRVREKLTNTEVPLMNYVRLQEPGVIEEAALNRVISGISTRNYREAVISVPETFGIKHASVSRKWVRASAKKLKELMDRRLDGYDVVSIIIDGKSFGENGIITALGVTLKGEKVILGFVEAGTENYAVCRDFLNELIRRGLRTENEILFIMDGGKGVRKAVGDVFGDKVLVQRCQWHKRENVLEYLNPGQRPLWRKKLQEAYEQKTYLEAKVRLESLKKELRFVNLSAVKSLEEGFEETLTLHRIGMFEKLGTSFKTTNCIENVNRLLGIRTDRVCRWRNSDHRQRWVAAALIKIEPNLRKIKGHRYLPELRKAMKEFVRGKMRDEMKEAA